MMALMDCGTKCPCGAELKGRVRKPTPFTNSFVKLTCKECGSRFMISCVRDMEEKPNRVFTTHVDLLELSPAAEKVIKSPLSFKAKALKEKVLGSAKGSASAIQTDLDSDG
jgi:hypothetical protein